MYSKLKIGKIELIIGPMFSGKTSELIRRVRRYTYGKKGKKVVILKWKNDLRNNESKTTIKTHDNGTYDCIRVDPNLIKIKPKSLEKYDVIGIDEGHFFKNLVEFCTNLADKHGKIVIISALSSNFNRNVFKSIGSIIPHCDSIDMLKSVCIQCSNDACFTMKTGDESKIIEIGGLDMYQPVCRKCYNQAKDFNYRYY